MVDFEGKLDPSEVLDFVADMGAGLPPVLDVDNGEAISSFGIAVTAEAALLGLEIVNDDPQRQPALTQDELGVKFWLRVNAGLQHDPAFDANGAKLGVELTVQTTSVPARTRQRTYNVQVVQL